MEFFLLDVANCICCATDLEMRKYICFCFVLRLISFYSVLCGAFLSVRPFCVSLDGVFFGRSAEMDRQRKQTGYQLQLHCVCKTRNHLDILFSAIPFWPAYFGYKRRLMQQQSSSSLQTNAAYTAIFCRLVSILGVRILFHLNSFLCVVIPLIRRCDQRRTKSDRLNCG